ncbi:MAG: response regulator transcription factor [Chloroflexi bacterium]|nr:MAG: response regulator transcription factor [Chloroflexota bacterium]
MIRVLIVDDHDGVRTATRLILGFETDLQVVGDAPNGLAGLRLARELRPDIMVLDLSMPGMDGFDVMRQLAAMKTDIRVVILSGDTAMRSAALACGAAHFVAKGCAGAELAGAVRQAYESRKRPVSTLAITAPLPHAV